ncbi:MAG: AAA family ATPase [Verrucomicrobiota bacterium]
MKPLSERKRLDELESYLTTRIIGQKHVIPQVANEIRNGELSMHRESEPRGRLFFCGPTGVGKTQMAESITEFIFGSAEYLHKFDMSEFKGLNGLEKFIGNISGEVGRLGYVLEKHQKGTLLFDEFEKADASVWELFLQILDKARITVGRDKTIMLSEFYIVFTSNEGSEKIIDNKYTPFTRIEEYVRERVKLKFKPEMIQRFKNLIVFNKLSIDEQTLICRPMLEMEIDRLSKKFNIKIDYEAEILNLLVSRGYDAKYGARNMKNVIDDQVRNALAKHLVAGDLASGKLIFNRSNHQLDFII